jgi:polyphosphate kinase
LQQQSEFDRIWISIQLELRKNKIFLKNERQLTKDQRNFVVDYFEQEVRSNIIPLMVESLPEISKFKFDIGCVLQK